MFEVYNVVGGSKDHPEYNQRDAAILAELALAVRRIFSLRVVDDGQGNVVLTAGRRWRLCLTDKHPHEESPHFMFDVGEGEKDQFDLTPNFALTVKYFDFHPEPATLPLGSPLVSIDPGEYIITIWVDDEAPEGNGAATAPQQNVEPEIAAQLFRGAYEEAMRKWFPDFAVMT